MLATGMLASLPQEKGDTEIMGIVGGRGGSYMSQSCMFTLFTHTHTHIYIYMGLLNIKMMRLI